MPNLRTLQSMVEPIRKRPGMYFGCSGPPAIPCIIRSVLYGVLSKTPLSYAGPLEVVIGGPEQDNAICIAFTGLNLPLFAPDAVHLWEERLSHIRPGMLFCAAAATDFFRIESSNGASTACFDFRGRQPTLSRKMRRCPPFVRIRFRPFHDIWRFARHDEIYKVAGCLHDFAALRAGLRISFIAKEIGSEISYYYAKGLESLLFESDYHRHASHPGCISFKAKKQKDSIEGCLRFLHAGVPYVRTFVNYQPTQGGDDLVGLGRALKELFPDEKGGCRRVTLFTNPDRELSVQLPIPFIGAMHFRTDSPRFYGPTSDVLYGDDVSDLVFESIKDQIKEQWTKLSAQRLQ